MNDDHTGAVRTMLVAFRAENVRSFKDPIDFSLQATAMSEPGVPREIPWRHGGRSFVRVLPVAAVFGANASGKTNLLRVMDDMRRIVVSDFHSGYATISGRKNIDRSPFRLDPEYEKKPSRYEVEVILDGVRHEYGFEVDDRNVISEWARKYTNGRAATIFRRNRDGKIHLPERHSAKAQVIKEITKRNTLVLTVAAKIDYEPLRPLANWFERNLFLCAASSRESRWGWTTKLLEDDKIRDQVLEMLQIADLGIAGAVSKKPDPDMLDRFRKAMKVLRESEDEDDVSVEQFNSMFGFSLSHKGTHGRSVELDSSDESLGTLVWLGMIGPVLGALAGGHVLLADELESSLHPTLVSHLVKMFQSSYSNPNGAQLIFNSHEARLLGNSEKDRVIGRDQAWFVEKLNDGSSHLYPLTDLNPRKTEAIARRYIEGRYGATPLVSNAEFQSLAARIAAGGED